MVEKVKVNSLRAFQQAFKSDVTKGNMYSVPPSMLVEEEGFNVRDYNDPDVVAHVRSLADAYKRGDYVDPVVVKVVEGQLLIREGHCRRRAMLLAISEGAELLRTPVLEFKGDEADQAALIVSSNSGLKITALQTAAVYKRLAGWGFSEGEIAERVGKTSQHVNQMLALLELPLELKQQIEAKVISATAALDIFREKGREAVNVVQEAVNKAKEQGKTKVTKKNLQDGPKPLPRKVAGDVRTAFGNVAQRLQSQDAVFEGDTVIVTMSREEVEGLLAVQKQIEEFEAKQAEKERKAAETAASVAAAKAAKEAQGDLVGV